MKSIIDIYGLIYGFLTTFAFIFIHISADHMILWVVGEPRDSRSWVLLWWFLHGLGPVAMICATIPHYYVLMITSLIVGSFMGVYGTKTGFSDLTWLTIPMLLLSLFIFVRSILCVCYSNFRNDHQLVAEDENTQDREESLPHHPPGEKAKIKWDPSTKTLIVV
jgi:4-amino-4-deoxy-L-arabinose transferase-like glycosyltransferase